MLVINYKGENLIYRARRINEKNSKEIVYDLTFSLPKSRASECKLILKHNGTPKLNINDLSNIPNAKADIKEALNDTTGAGSGKLHFKSDSSNFYLYRFYGYLEANADDSFDVTLIDTAGLVMDTLKSPVGISEDSGHMNIISTIYALTAMPSGATDPLNTDSIATLSDSSKFKLLITAMVDLSLAHNSPQPDENEQSQGIFTNYMQFMDNVVGKWATIGSGAIGIIRLRNIHNAILEQNWVEIIDPVQVINRGTCFDGNKNAKRQNYAFYEGYSRVNWEVEKPDYSGKKSGIGVMFRVSENIELYGAKLGIESAAFDTAPFLTGKQGTRIILKSDDSLLSKITGDSSGCWLKGIPETGKERFEIGITPVRLTIKELTIDPVKTAIPFSLTNEEKRRGDIEGEIIDDGERSILKVMPVLKDNKINDQPVINLSKGELMIHGGIRKITYDTNYLSGKLIYELVGDSVSKEKVIFYQTGKEATLIDTGVFGTLSVIANVYYNKLLVSAIEQRFSSRHICLKDADLNGNYTVLTDGLTSISARLETDDKNWLIPAEPEKSPVVIEWNNGIRIYKKSDTDDDKNLLWPPSTQKNQASGKYIYPNWNEFKSTILEKLNSFYVVCTKSGKSTVTIHVKIEENTETKIPVEKIEIIVPELQIKDNKNNDLTNNVKKFSPKKNGPARIDVIGYSDDYDYINKIKIDVNYDASNTDHTGFYGSNPIVYTTTKTFTGSQENYSFEWDGRDNRENRILLGGNYNISAEITTEAGKKVTVQKSIQFAVPQILTVGMNYPVDESTLKTFKSRNNSGNINWNAVDFLDKKKHSDFKWLYQYSLAMSLMDKNRNYENNNNSVFLNDKFILTDQIADNAAVYRFMGHHTVEGATGEVLLGGGKYIYSHCIDGVGPVYCASKRYCMNRDCNDNLRGAFMDDVLLAVAIGCQTGVGMFSTAQAMIDAGADCVVGTQIQVSIPLIIFWNVYFWRYLNNGASISDAIQIAFETALEKLLEFTTYPDIQIMSQNLPGINTSYSSTLRVLNHPSTPNTSSNGIIPARYGAKTME